MPLVSLDVQAIPKVRTVNASSLISDSGYVRYRVEAKIWEIYSNEGDPYEYYPEGIHVEQFDSLFNRVGSIVADTAYNYERKQLWHAIGNVVVKNLEGRIFETSELFWNLKTEPNTVEAFYTNRPVKITEPDGSVTYGRDGFRADNSLNIIRLFAMSGEFNVDDSNDSLPRDSLTRDSIIQP